MKIFKYALIGLVVIGASVVGYIYLPDLLAKQQAAKVTGTVAYDLTACSSEYPLLVEIKNGSNGVVTWVSFHIEGHREGYSTPLYKSGFRGYSSDKIISSGYIGSNCWRLPPVYSGRSTESHPPEDLIWKIENIYPEFNPEFQNL